MSRPEEEDMALKILHTADWHLGLRFPAFDEADQLKLTRAIGCCRSDLRRGSHIQRGCGLMCGRFV